MANPLNTPASTSSKLLTELLRDISRNKARPGASMGRQEISGQNRTRLDSLVQSITTNRPRRNRP